jgi:hypothetical protein
MTWPRTATHEETELLTVLYFPFRARTPMEFNFETGSLLLLIAAVVAMLTRRLGFPYSVGLVVAGIALVLSLIIERRYF